MKLLKNIKSFTLVELMVAISIVSVLAAVGGLSLTQWVGESKDMRVRSDVTSIGKSLALYSTINKLPIPDGCSETESHCQGEIGSNVVDKVDELTSVPKGPNGRKYTYIYTNNGEDFQVVGELESQDQVLYGLIGDTIYANNGEPNWFVKGSERIPVILNSASKNIVIGTGSSDSSFEIYSIEGDDISSGFNITDFTNYGIIVSAIETSLENTDDGEDTGINDGEDTCNYDECLFDGTYVISTDNLDYPNGCNDTSLPNAEDTTAGNGVGPDDLCILKIASSNMYISPGSAEFQTRKDHWDKGETILPTLEGGDLYDDSDLNGAITGGALENGDYGAAAQHCANLTGGGLNWRLPPMGNANDMTTGLSLEEGIGSGGLADIFVAFDNNMLIAGDLSSRYWSSTFKEYFYGSKWFTRNLLDGSVYNSSDYSNYYVRCIATK